MVKISLLAQIMHKVRLLYIFVREQMFYKKAQSFLGEMHYFTREHKCFGSVHKVS